MGDDRGLGVRGLVRRGWLVTIAIALCVPLLAGQSASALLLSRAAVPATATGGTWKAAQEVPGFPALNPGGFAEISSVSCAAPGDCAAGGYYSLRFAEPP